MSAEQNKALVRRFYEEIAKGNLDAMDELVAEDYVDHNPPPFPGPRAGTGECEAGVRVCVALPRRTRRALLFPPSAVLDAARQRAFSGVADTGKIGGSDPPSCGSEGQQALAARRRVLREQ